MSLVSSFLSCTLAFSPSPQDLTEYINCVDKSEKIEFVRSWSPIVSLYIPSPHIEKTLLVIYCESRGKADATNINTNSEGLYKDSIDKGILQWNSVTFDWLSSKLNIPNDPYNPIVSLKALAWTLKHVGWSWWNSSKACWSY